MLMLLKFSSPIGIGFSFLLLPRGYSTRSPGVSACQQAGRTTLRRSPEQKRKKETGGGGSEGVIYCNVNVYYIALSINHPYGISPLLVPLSALPIKQSRQAKIAKPSHEKI
jgi:hypothetical protein